VFAACGTPVVAARGGRVAVKQYEGRAGNHVVIDGAATGVDYAYMHLCDAALVEVGYRVRTGQLIGFVGSTGRASGCHLHFEMWSGPGWYAGGAPVRSPAEPPGLGSPVLIAGGRRGARRAAGERERRLGRRQADETRRSPPRAALSAAGAGCFAAPPPAGASRRCGPLRAG
jgi:murein DD-endopeptidase MepM/ murein hydrolase activator NlpD